MVILLITHMMPYQCIEIRESICCQYVFLRYNYWKIIITYVHIINIGNDFLLLHIQLHNSGIT